MEKAGPQIGPKQPNGFELIHPLLVVLRVVPVKANPSIDI